MKNDDDHDSYDVYVYVFVRIIFRTPGGVYKKISDCCHDIHMVADITLIYRVYYIQ